MGQPLDALEGRPDRDELDRALRQAQLESERRMTGQLDSVSAKYESWRHPGRPPPAARKAATSPADREEI